MEQKYKKSYSLFVIISVAIWVIGIPPLVLWQLQKMDRKLTCIYNAIEITPLLENSSITKTLPGGQEAINAYEASCDKFYIFSGIPRK